MINRGLDLLGFPRSTTSWDQLYQISGPINGFPSILNLDLIGVTGGQQAVSHKDPFPIKRDVGTIGADLRTFSALM